jgi:two-component system response regulator AtoC
MRNVVEYAFAVGRGSELSVDDLPVEFREVDSAEPQRLAEASGADERRRIETALEQSGGHLGRAADRLGISRATLWRKRKRYGI